MFGAPLVREFLIIRALAVSSSKGSTPLCAHALAQVHLHHPYAVFIMVHEGSPLQVPVYMPKNAVETITRKVKQSGNSFLGGAGAFQDNLQNLLLQIHLFQASSRSCSLPGSRLSYFLPSDGEDQGGEQR
jgi:hypothetical protein